MVKSHKQLEKVLNKRKITLTSTFVFVTKHVDLKCQICNYSWSTTPRKLTVEKTGCPKCAGKLKLTTEEFIHKAKSVHSDLYDYSCSKYITSSKPINIQCRVHGVFKTTPNRHLTSMNGCCPKCADNTTLSNFEFDRKLQQANRGIVRVDEYINSHTPLNVMCSSCCYQWKARPTKLHGKSATGCPKCRTRKGLFGTHTTIDGIQFRSMLEGKCYEIVKEFCKSKTYTFENQKRYPQSDTNHTCDFYINELQLWIEVSGIQTKVYKTRLQKKVKWIEELQETFLFVRTPEQLRKILYGTV